jgi:hypothetical protein
MAEREDIRKRSININPQAATAGEAIERVLAKHGLICRARLTEDMTPQEEEMELFAGYLKEGYSENMAEKKAKEALALMARLFSKDKK